jgi:signal transduction histidine kinase/DNA-binding response OmpR family regulator/streptogramin lyase
MGKAVENLLKKSRNTKITWWQKTICVVALLFLWVLKTDAQQTLQFQNFAQKEGLSSNYILSIHQDHQGFIWIGTENGLNRFDGQHFLSFRSDPEDPETINNNWISAILEDTQHQLWIGTDRGLNRLDIKTGKVERIPLLQDGQAVESLVNHIYEASSGELWVSTQTKGLFKLGKNRKEQKWRAEHLAYSLPFWEKKDILPIFNVVHVADEEVWAVTSAGIDHIDLSSLKTIRYPFNGQGETYKGELDEVYGLLDEEGKIYVGFENKLYVLDITENDPVLHTVKSFTSSPNSSFPITRDLLFDSPDVLLVPSYRNLAQFNLKNGKLTSIKKEGQVREHLFNDPIHITFKDKKGNYWIGTSGGGLFLGQNRRSAFTFYQHDPANLASISDGQIRSFLEEENGNLWIGIINHGLDYLTRQDNGLLRKTKSITASISQPNSLASDRVIKIIRGDEKSIWVATNNNGLIQLDSTGKPLKTFTYQPNNPNSLSGNRIWGLAKDQQGDIWIGTWQNGLNRLNPHTGQIERFFEDPRNLNSIGSNNIRYIFIDKHGILWIGTSDGLTRFNPDKQAFSHFSHDTNDPQSLSDNLVWAIYEDKNGDLWVGTNTGLNRFDPHTQGFERFYEKDGLPDNSIYGILEDDAGLLWVSTSNGLARKLSDTSRTSFLSFGISDGLKTASFIPKAYLNSRYLDQLYFGSAEGILVVKPSLLEQDTSQAQLAIHSMRRFKRKATPAVELTDYFVNYQEQTVKLGYQDQSVTFTLADLNWMDHPNYKYEYRLVGFNRRWIPLEEDMQVRFSSLPPGKYTLLARAGNSGNLKFEAVELLSLRVFPPWWRTWWAYTFYFLVLGIIVLAVYRSQLRRQLVRQEAENLRALDTFKNNLYTNITHEFRTPLTIILGMVEQMEKQPKRMLKTGFDLIRKNGNNLLNLVNQILELQKLESGKLEVDMIQGDILPYLRNIFDQFLAYGNSKEQSMEFITELETLQMDYDPEKTLRIVSNLLSNAIKYTPPMGKVTFTISSGNKPELGTNPCLILGVQDTGRGIPKDQLPHIFDRFFQASSNNGQVSESGTGIGLSLTQELVHLLNGKIELSSEIGKGTTFKVFLPITRSAGLAQVAEPVNIKSAIFGTSTLPGKKQAPAGDLPFALIVEDNPDIAQYLQICLEGHYRLELAPNGQIGIDKALELIPDIIISDVMMPEKNGFELCETLKEDIRTSHIPIILLTAKSDVESRIVGLKQGADDYLAKPFHEEELLVRMQNLLSIRQKLQERYQNLYDQPLPKSNASVPSKEDDFILNLKAVFEERMDNPQFDVNALSQKLHLSRSQLGRKVKALTGRSLSVYLRSLRLQKARQLLLSTDLPMKEIAYDVGFPNPSYFSTSYTEEFGESPTNTRDSRQMHK